MKTVSSDWYDRRRSTNFRLSLLDSTKLKRAINVALFYVSQSLSKTFILFGYQVKVKKGTERVTATFNEDIGAWAYSWSYGRF